MDLVPSYDIISAPLFQPKLEDFAPILQEKLSSFYGHVEVSVTDCPDLTQKPFNMAGKGLGGRTAVAQLGGVPYLMPVPVQPMPIYSLVDISQRLDFKEEAHVLGAGCSPVTLVSAIAEYMPNIHLIKDQTSGKTKVTHNSRMSRMRGKEKYCHGPLDTDCVCMLCDIYVSENKPGKVLKVVAEKRFHEGGKSLTEAMRQILAETYPEKAVSMGGVFLVTSGSINIHVMPEEFGKENLDTLEKVDKWLNFFDAKAPIVAMTSFHAKDTMNMNLRLEHTHCYSDHGEGGHYHYDTSPGSIAYEGYFNFAERVYRVDKPKKDIKFQ
ncbi:ester hydrolase C11orf54 homolog [Brevipalpus obovatus]|uniref:ester hydrolase C11orf54 homolog n=1 Tax=Brevipalpus obovatus TaxID=246614 RepID=UPI003D9E660E